MKKNLQNKRIILTGASSGIGREMSKILVRDYGARVIGIGRNEAKLQALADELDEKFSYRAFDVSVKENWLAFARELQEREEKIDFIINNAGAFPTFAKLQDTPSETLEKILRTNFFSCVYAAETMRTCLGEKGGIVNICSSAALCTVVGTGAYSASKAALKGFTETLMLEEKGRYVGLIFPGTTATELFRNDENTKNSALDLIAMKPQKMARKIVKKIAKNRKRAVVGWDAKAMNLVAKIAPVWGLKLICFVMRKSRSKVFEKVFKE